MNRVVLSSDKNLDYAFYAPIVSLAWRRRGYRPLLLLVGSAESWLADPRLRLALQRSREVGAVVHFITVPARPVGGRDVPEVDGVRTSTVAQCARIFGALVPVVEDDDYLLISDVDMLPIGPWIGSGRGDVFTIWYANAYAEEVAKTGRPHWPMCYVGAPAARWRSYFGDSLSEMLTIAPKEASSAWAYDELWMSKRLAEHPEQLTLVPRTFVEGEWRVDRSDWDGTLAQVLKRGTLDGVADAHLIRPGFGDNWLRLAPLLTLAFSSEDFAWCAAYRSAWEAIK